MTTPTAVVIVLTTLPEAHDAEGFAQALVSEGLAACVSVLPPMRSVYRWQGAIERADERQVLIKTTTGRLEGLERRFSTLHPYDLPEFVVLAVSGGSTGYLGWVEGQSGRG